MSDCGKYLVVTPIKGCKNNLLYYAELRDDYKVEGKLNLKPIVTEFNADYEVNFTNNN